MALELLAAACPGAESLISDLAPLVARHPLAAPELDLDAEEGVLRQLLQSPDPYLRAAAAWAAAPLIDSPLLAEPMARARDDEHALVRETATAVLARRGALGARGLPAHLSTIETMHLLHAVPIFSGLDPDDLHELALYAIDDTVVPPAALFEEGDADCDALFVILGGRVTVERSDPSGGGAVEHGGAPAVIETLGPGSVVGDLSVLDGSRRDSTVRPDRGPVRVLRIPGTRFRSGLLRSERVTEWLLGALAGRIRRLAGAARRS